MEVHPGGKNKAEACALGNGGTDPPDKGNIGGDDGFALKYDMSAKPQGGGLTLYPNCNDKDLFYDQPSDSSDYGVGYHRADHVDYDPVHCGDKSDNREYNWDSGDIGVNFSLSESCKRPVVAVISRFGHSWEKTRLTGFQISVDGIGIQWENKGHDFESFPNESGFADCHY